MQALLSGEGGIELTSEFCAVFLDSNYNCEAKHRGNRKDNLMIAGFLGNLGRSTKLSGCVMPRNCSV